MRRMMKWLYMIAQMDIQTPLRSRDLDHVGYSPLCSSRLSGKRLGTGPEILQEEEYHLPETNTVFYRHMWSLLNRLSKNVNEANCVEKGHSANFFVYRITLIYQGFWSAIHTQQSKDILGLITGQFKISSLISSEGQTRDPFVTFFGASPNPGVTHPEVFIDAPNLRLWDLWLSIGFSMNRKHQDLGFPTLFVHGPSEKIRFSNWLNQVIWKRVLSSHRMSSLLKEQFSKKGAPVLEVFFQELKHCYVPC